MTTYRSRQRIRWVGIHGRETGPLGDVIRQLRDAVRVRWDDGRIEDVHPEDIVAITAESKVTNA